MKHMKGWWARTSEASKLLRIICFESVTRSRSHVIPVNAPVTIVSSVPWERERDIMEDSPLWELLPFQPFWSPIGSRQSMTGQLSRSMQMHANTDKLRGSINAVPATITSESDTERRLAYIE